VSVMLEADVAAGGTWEAIGVTVLDGPSGAGFPRCVKRAIARLTLPDFEGVSRRTTHFYGLRVD